MRTYWTLLRRYALFGAVVVVDLLLCWQNPGISALAVKNSLSYLAEMLLFFPPIMVLVGLLDTWVPREVVEKNVGPRSGARGVAISILAATAAAGPLYAGFPVADALLKKGCRLANAVIFLGAWATIKIPMLLAEAKFVGLAFALWRLALTLLAIIITGYLVERILQAGGQEGTFCASENTWRR
ncbi:conserved hypothetical protein [Ammonifex degensii KC4]|uniref:Permease n=1 Tax=Ammonifex degensii (strain DSM 10501 / KC4) TaxID=429009 RepID=C9RDB4_AMMDK|nr:permease [Ammonifex degensii]ACX52241.1 conserved hypothetical protein [Ammonifex degensii KC4]